MFQIHFPFTPKNPNGQNDWQGRQCPMVGQKRHLNDIGICNLFSITHPGSRLPCDGVHVNSMCDLAHSNDVVVHFRPDRVSLTPEPRERTIWTP